MDSSRRLQRYILPKRAEVGNGYGIPDPSGRRHYRQRYSDGRKNDGSGATSKRGAGKKGRTIALLGGSKGGVEHNRYTRAINPLLNKATGGVWEKGMRIGRAGLGLIKVDAETGKFAGLSGTAVTIIIAFVLQMLMKWQNHEIQKADRMNAQNFKQLENGSAAVRGAYKITSNFWTGRYTYNENK